MPQQVNKTLNISVYNCCIVSSRKLFEYCDFRAGGTKGRAIVSDASGSIDGCAVDQRAFVDRGGL